MKISFAFLTLVLSFGASAQTVSSLDGLTPVPLSPGAPAGSYALSNVDTVSLYNGGLNVAIPLLQIGGRGQAGYTMMAQYGPRWDGTGSMQPCDPTVPNSPLCPVWWFGTNGWTNWNYVYRPAGIAVRQMGLGSYTPTDGNLFTCSPLYAGTLARVYVSLADGTEIPLVDSATGGSPEGAVGTLNCVDPQGHNAFHRGTTFVSTDGSAMTFVADADVVDQLLAGSAGSYGVTGTLYFKDGRQYHFSGVVLDSSGVASSVIDWVQDRNGNRTTFAYNVALPALFPSGFLYNFSITDPVGRVTYVGVSNQYTLTDDPNAGCTTSAPCTGFYDQIAYPGTNGVLRSIIVKSRSYWYDRMASLQGSAWPTFQNLFGGYSSPSSSPFDNAISQILLPDGNSYQFHYTQYSEIARLDLPTGGAYEFDWQNGPNVDPNNLCPQNPEGICPVVIAPTSVQAAIQTSGYNLVTAVYRRLGERREYANGGSGSSWTRRTTYSVAESNTAVSGDPLGQCGFTSNAQFVSGYCSNVTVTEHDPQQSALAVENHYFYGGASQSQSLFPQPGWYPWWLESREARKDAIQPSTSATLQQEFQTWQNRAIPTWWSSNPSIGPQPALDSRLGGIDTIIDNGKMSRRLMTYSTDAFNNLTDLYEHDYGNTSGTQGNLLRHTHSDYVTDTAYTQVPVHLISLPSSQTVDGGGAVLSQIQYCYDEGTSAGGTSTSAGCSPASSHRGNVTTAEKWRNTDNLWLKTATAYDANGNITSVQNPRTYTTTYTYQCSNSFPYQIINPKNQQTSYAYDCSLGKPTSIVDPNGTTSLQYNDPFNLDRLTHVTLPDQSNTDYQYSSDLKTLTTIKDLDAGRRTTTSTTTDGLGRNIQNVDAAGVVTNRDLDALGRLYKAYNPGSSADFTTHTYDALGRTLTITYADNSLESFQWTGDLVVHTDPAQAKTQQQTDALGRLLQVVEDYNGGGLTTTYTYDALDNLTGVSQPGLTSTCATSQSRCFVYDSLKQLVSANNPETGTTAATYGYDPDGNLQQRVAGPVTTSFQYDELDRLKYKSYAGGVATPSVTYCYDGQVVSSDDVCGTGSADNSTGRLTDVKNSVSETHITGYTPLGKPSGSIQTTAGQQPYSFIYTYDLAGDLVSAQYPSRRTTMNGYDSAGRLCSVSGIVGTPPAAPYPCTVTPSSQITAYANNVQYTPQESLQSIARGDSLTETWQYNNRLQATSINVGPSGTAFGMSLYYCPNHATSCTSNNGNVFGITLASPGVDQNFGYDHLNRLLSITEGSNVQAYNYDNRGNRYWTQNTGSFFLSPFLPGDASGYNSQNQLVTAGSGAQYPDRGNQTALGAMTFTYDGESRMATSVLNGATTTYQYDGDGRRVQKVTAAGTTTFVYDVTGNLVAEYGGVVTAPCSTCYISVDHLGSTRALTDATGSVKERHDYLPFGDEIFSGTGGRTTAQGYLNPTTAQGVMFTGQYRDGELSGSSMPSGLDYFGARYFSGAQGRFTSVDPELIPRDITNPQIWNKYAYALNNPLRFVDPDGAAVVDAGLVQIGTASFRVYQPQQGATFDRAALLSTVWMGQIGSNQSSINRNLEEFKQNQSSWWFPTQQNGEGGCVLGCVGTFNEQAVGITLNVGFNYDKNDQLTGATITPAIDQNARFMSSNPGPTVTMGIPLAGMTPPGQTIRVDINSAALKNLSPQQLQALAKAAAKVPIDSVRTALSGAISQEQKRRADEQRKHCQSGQSDCSNN